MTQQSNAIIVRENQQISTTRATDIDIFRLGKAFAGSGYFADAKDEAQAVVKIIYGQELGISPAASMSGIHIIKGKPVLSATALAGLIKSRRPLYDYRVLELNNTCCELEFFEQGKSVGKSSFTLEEARIAEVTTSNSNWKKYPKNMLFARAISNGARLYCPDIFTGSPVYTPDEMGANVDDDGAIILDVSDNTKRDHRPDTKAQVEVQNKETGFDNEHKNITPINDKVRVEIKEVLEKINIDPKKSLTKYDSLTSTSARENALMLTLRQAVNTGLQGQTNAEEGWTADEIDVYLSGFGVDEGVNSATIPQLREIYEDMVFTKLI